MRQKIAAIAALALAALQPFAGYATTLPGCGDANVQAKLHTAFLGAFERHAETAAGKYSQKSETLRKFFYAAPPKVVYTQNLTGFASQGDDKEGGKRYCSATNKSTLAVELRFKINPHYAGDEKDLLADAVGSLASQGENARVDGDDGIVVAATLPVSHTINYTVQFSGEDGELVVSLR